MTQPSHKMPVSGPNIQGCRFLALLKDGALGMLHHVVFGNPATDDLLASNTSNRLVPIQITVAK